MTLTSDSAHRPLPSPNGRSAHPLLTADEALMAARALAPTLRERAAQTEALRQVPHATIEQLLNAGLFGIATPRSWGGSELGPEAWVEVIAEIASACGSTGWVYGVLLGHMWLVSLFPPAAQAEVFGESDALVASLVRLGGTAPERVAGGYRWRSASGRFCSGIDHAAWVIAGGSVTSADGGAEERWFLIPRSEIEIVDDWYTMGLRGTGSKSLRVDDVFIPEHRVILQSDIADGVAPGLAVNPGPLYRLPGTTWSFVLAATPLGIARGAVEQVCASFAQRLRGLDAEQAAEQSATLSALAKAATDVDVAYALLQARARRLMQTSHQPYTLLEAAAHRRDVAYAVQQARHALNCLMELSGGSGIYQSADIQRSWRDCNAAAAHTGFVWAVASTAYGRALVGLPSSRHDRHAPRARE